MSTQNLTLTNHKPARQRQAERSTPSRDPRPAHSPTLQRALVTQGQGLTPQDLITLQQTAGNRAVQRLLSPSQVEGGSPLPWPVQRKMEDAFDADFSDVRIHQGKEPAALGAIAYAQGSHLYFEPGRYDPASRSGQELLGHELAHVVQQRAGQVPASDELPLNADRSLESQADRAGERAARGQAAGIHPASAPAHSADPIQGKGGLIDKFLGLFSSKKSGAKSKTATTGGMGALVDLPKVEEEKPEPEELSKTPPKNYGTSEVQPTAPGAVGKIHTDFDKMFQEKILANLQEGETAEEMLKYKGDYANIMKLMLDKDATEKHLGPLEKRMKGMAEDNEGELPKRALGTALASQQKKFGFSTNQEIPLGILSADEFLGIYQKGLVPKDIGAGMAHGERSHELQWSAIMSKFESDTKKRKKGDESADQWNHVPLELLTKLADPRFGWLQGHMMDKGMNVPGEGYRRPDSMTHNMLEDETTRARLPNISSKVEGHFRKRQAQAWDEGKDPMTIPNSNARLIKSYGKAKQDKGWLPNKADNPTLLRTPAPAEEASVEERIAAQRQKWFGEEKV